MKRITILWAVIIFAASACKNDGTGTSSGEAIKVFEEKLLQITPDALVFSGGNREALPFSGDTTATTFVLVRHAEKDTTNKNDPDLTQAGKDRARLLADVVQLIKIDAVYSTQVLRTLKTATPTVAMQKAPLIPYNAEESEALMQRLVSTEQGKTFVIVGHSNNIPQMLNKISGNGKFAQIEESDYDNIYIVKAANKGKKINFFQASF